MLNKCPSCFSPLSGGTICPQCGRDYSKDRQYPGCLPPFTLLNNRYIVGRVLGKGGFGITYIAKDTMTNNICAIKEYMPSEYAQRSNGSLTITPFTDDKAKFVFTHGREKFYEEASTLHKLRNNPIVVDILAYFNQNNTAYLVMEYLGGHDLRKLAKANGGKIDPEIAKMIFVTIASSLMEIHKMNILHRDLSPENIFFTNDNRIKLIDFGAARNFVSTQNKGMCILLKPGFAPPEQYNAKGNQGPWSDVYALCATFYTLVSGKALVDALFRYRGEVQPSLYSLGCPVSKKTSDVIEKGMALDFKQRYRDFKELLDDIDIVTSHKRTQPVPQPMPRPVPQPVPQPVPRPVPQPVPQPVPRPVPQPAPQPIPRPVPQPAPQPMPRPVPQPVPQPAPHPVPQPARPYVAGVVGNTLCNKTLIGSGAILKIGRSVQSCQFVVSGDTNISRIHCYLRYENNTIYLCDTSSNGTFFENGMQLVKNKEYIIRPGTKFYLATQNHMFVVGI